MKVLRIGCLDLRGWYGRSCSSGSRLEVARTDFEMFDANFACKTACVYLLYLRILAVLNACRNVESSYC